MTVTVPEQLTAIRRRLGERRSAAQNAGRIFFESTRETPDPALSDTVKEDLRHILNRVQMSVRLNDTSEGGTPNSGLPLTFRRVTEVT